MPECPPRNDLRAYGLELAREKQIPETMYDRQVQQESGWEHCGPGGSLKVSSGNAVGVAQIIQRWHPDVDVTDPWASLRYSTDMMAGLYQRFGSWRKALAAYNWGPANVAGFTDSAGREHPAWDGSREWRCPHEGAVAQCRTAQRDHYLDVILGPGWPEPNSQIGQFAEIVYEDFRDPAPAGRLMSTPKGIILHGSRSGHAGNRKEVEARGTARYEQDNPAGLGWHATIGEHWVAVHLTPQEWGWNARAASSKYLAVELAQATVDEPITDAQVDALADWIQTRVLPVWPNLPLYFPTHADVERSGETGVRDGKSDVFPDQARSDELRGRLMARLDDRQEDEVTKAEADALRAENARLQEQVNGLVTAVAVLGDDVADAHQAQVDKAREIRRQFVGPRP